MKLVQVFNESNTIDAQGDIETFCSRHKSLSLDALLVCNCKDAHLLDKAKGLLRTGGVLALRGGDMRILSEVFGKRWMFGFCDTESDLIWTRICRRQGSSEVLWEDLPLAHYVDLLRRGTPFSYLRYGDGEWNCALGTVCQGYGFQEFTPELRRDIHVSLIRYHKDPRYIMALAPAYHYRNRGMGQWELMVAFLKEHNLTGIQWVSTEAFNRASVEGKLWPFVQYLQQHDIVIVGPPRYKALGKIFPKAAFVVIPPKHCHAQLPKIQRDILAQKHPAIVLISAGPACVVLIHKLYGKIGKQSTMIDIGSVWGLLIGIFEHGAHTRVSQKLINRNIGKV